jgi:purine-nucleoside phosphorylase
MKSESKDFLQRLDHTCAWLRERMTEAPETAIILGTGLGELVHDTEIIQSWAYREIPHFPIATAESHAGKLHLARWQGKAIWLFQGRFHHYEGYDMQSVSYPVRVSGRMGVKNLLISNISGALNPAYQISDLVAIEDHINLQTQNPLTGPNHDELGPRWPDMLDAYDPELRKQALDFAAKEGIPLHSGVYVSVPGPNLETPAEYRFLARIGADCVGMSTVPEVIVARHMGLRVFAVSAISDLGYGQIQKTKLEELLHAAAVAQPRITAIFRHLVAGL